MWAVLWAFWVLGAATGTLLCVLIVALLVVRDAIASGGPSASLAVSTVADAASVTAGSEVGFTLTVANRGNGAAAAVTLSDALPAGTDLSWGVDGQTGIAGCSTSGAVGAQSISCPAVDLAPGAGYHLHVISHTSPATAASVADSATASAADAPAATSSATIAVNQPSGCVNSAADPTRTLAFDDEFTTDTTIDPTKWTTGSLPFGGLDGSTHYHNTQYGSYIVPDDAFLQNGLLNLTTTNVPVTNPDVPKIGTIPYTEGYMHTKSKFSRTGGYFEFCAKFPAGKGLWPAFWLAAQNGNWPPEIDIAEWFGSLGALQLGQPFSSGSNAGNCGRAPGATPPTRPLDFTRTPSGGRTPRRARCSGTSTASWCTRSTARPPT